MTDPSSRPHTFPARTPGHDGGADGERRLRRTSPMITAELGMAVSTVCAVLVRARIDRGYPRRDGQTKLGRLVP